MTNSDLILLSAYGAAALGLCSWMFVSTAKRFDAAAIEARQFQSIILKELQTMSTTMTNQQAVAEIAADLAALEKREADQAAQIAQLTADNATLRANNDALTGQVVQLKTVADQAGQVSPELKAEIDQLHAFAQGGADAGAAPTGTGTTTASGEAGQAGTDQAATPAAPSGAAPVQDAPVAAAAGDGPSGEETKL